MIYCDNIEDISYVLGDGIFTMKEKDKLISSIEEVAKDKDVLKAVKLEDNIDYRFEVVREQSFEEGLEQGLEQGLELILLI